MKILTCEKPHFLGLLSVLVKGPREVDLNSAIRLEEDMSSSWSGYRLNQTRRARHPIPNREKFISLPHDPDAGFSAPAEPWGARVLSQISVLGTESAESRMIKFTCEIALSKRPNHDSAGEMHFSVAKGGAQALGSCIAPYCHALRRLFAFRLNAGSAKTARDWLENAYTRSRSNTACIASGVTSE